MKVEREDDFTLNGLTSWIHFLEFDLKKPKNISYHYHEYIEMVFFVEGEIIIWINGKSFKPLKNNLMIINSQRPHSIDIIKPSKYMCIKVMPNILYSDERFCDEFRYAFPFISEIRNEFFFNEAETEKLHAYNLICNIKAEWELMDYGFELAIKSNLLELFVRILRYLNKVLLIPKTNVIGPEIKKAIEEITENFSAVKERDVAKSCNLSYNHFSYLFKKTVGKNFKDFILDVRIREAEKLLLTTNKTITEISQETGFSSASHFINQFKTVNRVTPAKFRKS